MKNKILKILNDAKDASRVVAGVSTENKNKALSQMAKALLKNCRYILLQNAKDVVIAKKKGLSDAMIDRLRLTNKRIKDMAQAIKSVHGLKDPVGEVLRKWKRPNGLLIKKVRVPIGVLGIVYESRPNVTSDCAALCIKSGNACVLRGGSEAINSNLAIHRSITSGIEKFGIPREAIGMINVTDRAAVKAMLHADEYIDLIIPRGGESLIKHVAKNSTVPVVKHYKGVCHLYVDRSADLKKAKEIVLNAKVQRPGVCNAIENLLVHKDVARKFLPEAARALEEADVELRGCEKTRKILGGIRAATDKDWYEEYLDLTLAIKIVNNVEEAIAFINKYGSRHSDAIVTKNKKAVDKFLNNVDSACVYLNASTRFTDGHQFGMGAEIGISTDKIHARGPMALEELCTYKYIILGSGQIRQ